MRVKALLTTHDEIAVSPTEPQPYNKVIPKLVKEHIDTPTADVVSEMIQDQGKEAAMRTTVQFSNDLKTTEAQKKAVLRVAEEEIGYVQPDISFEEKLAQRLKGERKAEVESMPKMAPRKNGMAPR